MVEGIINTLFKMHVGRFIWYVDMWMWCWGHGAPIFVTRLLVMLIEINVKTARIYASKSRKEGTNDQAR